MVRMSARPVARVGFRLALSLLVLCLALPPSPAGAQTPTQAMSLVSRRHSDSLAGNGNSNWPSVSADGRFVAFESSASDLVQTDSNSRSDIFLRDMDTGITEMVASGSQSSSTPAISPNGRFVAFVSSAPDLVAGDTNNASDVFLYDAELDFFHRVSLSSSGAQANGHSHSPSVASNGTVAFASSASNLVTSDGNSYEDIFVHRLDDASTTRISRSTAGGAPNNHSGEPVIGGGGGHVAYYSMATNLVVGDTNGRSDIFVWDAASETTELVSRSATGGGADEGSYTPAITPDGRYVAFTSAAGNLVTGDSNGKFDIFVRDTVLDATELISVDLGGMAPNAHSSGRPSISDDGRFVAFSSSASSLVVDDTNLSSDVFVRDRSRDATERVSVTSEGGQAAGNSSAGMISARGRHVVFPSGAALISWDQNGSQSDIYRWDGLSTGFFEE